jgi:hypothetical protein
MQKSFSDCVKHTVYLLDLSLDPGKGDGSILKLHFSGSRESGASVPEPYVLSALGAEPMC